MRDWRLKFLRPVMQVALTLALGGAALYVILSDQYDDATKKWAFGTVGLLTGFWLKP